MGLSIYLAVLRVIHVMAAFVWVGSTFFFDQFMMPAVNATGQEGIKVMQHITQKLPYSMVLGIAATLTILTGALAFWPTSNGLSAGFMGSLRGISLSIGAAAGIAAWLVGMIISRAAASRMTALGKEIAAAGGPPKPEQLTEMGALRTKLENASRYILILSAIAVLGMAAAQTLIF